MGRPTNTARIARLPRCLARKSIATVGQRRVRAYGYARSSPRSMACLLTNSVPNGKSYASSGRGGPPLTPLEATRCWAPTGWEAARRERPDLSPHPLSTPLSPLAVLVPHEGGGAGHGGDCGGVVRTRGWGRGPTRRGLTVRAFHLTL